MRFGRFYGLLGRLSAFAFALVMAFATAGADAAILTTGFFSGTIERFDEVTGAQSTFATVGSASDPFPGLSGLAFDRANNRVLASARISSRVYAFDALTGASQGFLQLDAGSQPASIAVNSAGEIHVAFNTDASINGSTAGTIGVFDSAFNSVRQIQLPNFGVNNQPSGLAFDAAGNLVISTFGGVGLLSHDPLTGSTSILSSASPVANGQVAIEADGDILVGGAAFSSDILSFSSDGTLEGAPLISIDASILPAPGLGFASPDFTSPSGVAIDADGNIIVAALGRTNPTAVTDNFQSNGGLFKFSADGTLLQTFGVQTTPFSSVIVVNAVPEPGSIAVLCVLGGVVGGLRYRRRHRKPSQS